MWVVAILTVFCQSVKESWPLDDDSFMHPHHLHKISRRSTGNVLENSAVFWEEKAEDSLHRRLLRKTNENIAKNVVLFLGDGMSIPTISAARAYLGGEELELAFDKFPYSGLSKTYCLDRQVADSACSATAYLGGVKGNLGTIGVTGNVERKDCLAMTDRGNHVYSLAHHFQVEGKKTGLVTTARVTHASPAGVYAHTAERDWESDSTIIRDKEDPEMCKDIAHQLVFGETGRNLDVIFGGGRAEFLPNHTLADVGVFGKRMDGSNLINDWINGKVIADRQPTFITNRAQLMKLTSKTDCVLGLFTPDHMNYNLERDPAKEPSLEEMTRAAISVLNKSPNGYFLFVEGARIDMGHHMTQARKALNETVEFSKAVRAAIEMTQEADTLIVVTADHAHTMSYSGYATRGHDILGIGGMAGDKLPYTTLNYANGPGYKQPNGIHRYDISNDDLSQIEYKYPSISPMDSETHGGEDVAVYASGPWAHLFTGVMEQNLIPHLMSFASCTGPNLQACDILKRS